MSQYHMLTRTNVKGVPFIGRCRLCGAEGLPAIAVSFPCPGGLGKDYAAELVDVISGPSNDGSCP